MFNASCGMLTSTRSRARHLPPMLANPAPACGANDVWSWVMSHRVPSCCIRTVARQSADPLCPVRSVTSLRPVTATTANRPKTLMSRSSVRGVTLMSLTLANCFATASRYGSAPLNFRPVPGVPKNMFWPAREYNCAHRFHVAFGYRGPQLLHRSVDFTLRPSRRLVGSSGGCGGCGGAAATVADAVAERSGRYAAPAPCAYSGYRPCPVPGHAAVQRVHRLQDAAVAFELEPHEFGVDDRRPPADLRLPFGEPRRVVPRGNPSRQLDGVFADARHVIGLFNAHAHDVDAGRRQDISRH